MEQLGTNSFERFMNLHIPGTEPFICPDCGKKFKVNDAVIVKIQTESQHVSTEFHGRIVARKYRNIYYNIRFCSSCAKRRKNVSKIGLIIMFVIIPLVVGVWSLCKNEGGIGAFIGSILGTEFLCFVVYSIWTWLTMGSSIDIKYAAKCNAIAPNDLFV